jgi:hypothetical protein
VNGPTLWDVSQFSVRVLRQLELKVADALDGDWRFCGPLGRGAFVLRAALARLLWLAFHPRTGYSKLPCGWFEGRFEPEVVLRCGPAIRSVGENLEKLLSGQGPAFRDWIWTLLPSDAHPFDRTAVEADLELLTEVVSAANRHDRRPDEAGQPWFSLSRMSSSSSISAH